ncbi:MYB-like transcription factor ETC3 [Humulus lupulus]|uniref:MYB-like transcription factor ETC3 n=1 Tax=Humulus lupulus TaxID=3486 RepID=UPI002B4073DF|nr:MYB-like transcription factor ETC3 [Humulus lupulus]XP_062119593.1 MYB-like transcription factor ETC3 [Humulus lupulus]XP_062119594.1 MYB-like transcription factor ETC3 [Humulus lupulus]
MDKRHRSATQEGESSNSEEVDSIKNEFVIIKMTEQEEDLINRMYRLVGDRWDLIAGRIPGREAEEIEKFWLMRHTNTTRNYKVFSKKRRK